MSDGPSRLGDVAEYAAVTWLWDQGFEVFKNAGCTGPVDLIAMDKDGKIILLDVKTYRRSTGPTINSGSDSYTKTDSLDDNQVALGVQILGYDNRTGDFSFVNHRHETTYDRYRNKPSPQYDLGLCDTGC